MKSSPDASSFTIGLVTFIFFFSFISSFFNSVLTVRGQQMGRDSYLTLKIERSLPFFSPSDLLSGGEIRFSCSPCSGKRVSPGSACFQSHKRNKTANGWSVLEFVFCDRSA